MKKFIDLDLYNSGELRNCIYFLYQGKKLVYIGQSNIFLKRVGDHSVDKTFDRVVGYSFDGSKQEREEKEVELIRKYKPIYNKTNGKRIGEVHIDVLRSAIRKQGRFSYMITNGLKNYFKKNNLLIDGKYIKKEDANHFFKEKVGFDYNF